MKDRFFLDTNIFVYLLDNSNKDKSITSSEIIKNGIINKNCFISYQVVQELGNILTKKIKPIPDLQTIKKFYQYSVFPLLKFYPDSLFYESAMEIHFDYKISFYNSLIVRASQLLGCNILYSEDLQHEQKFNTVKVINPYLCLMKN